MAVKPNNRNPFLNPNDPDYDDSYDYEAEMERYERELEAEEDERRMERDNNQ